VYSILKGLLFQISPENAHALTTSQLKILSSIPGIRQILDKWWALRSERLEKDVMGLHFTNPIGLAAGFDKDGKYMDIMSSMGFGFYEVGTVTPLPQPGNPKPRLFRLPKDQALINRMGFNNEGVDQLVWQLQKYKRTDMILGGNIGKNKNTSDENTIQDYQYCFEKLCPHVDYFVFNVSSPNTPGLRNLQKKKPLNALLQNMQQLNLAQPVPRPLLLKIAPDLTFGQVDDILQIVEDNQLHGIIATNTTVERSGLQTDNMRIEKIGNGGLSGAPLRTKATQMISYIRKQANKELTIVGVGGIMNPTDALEKWNAGADLIQLYTGLIYYGPTIIKDIKKELLAFGNL
jgi:dihydroorotate dehydrogenase